MSSERILGWFSDRWKLWHTQAFSWMLELEALLALPRPLPD